MTFEEIADEEVGYTITEFEPMFVIEPIEE